MVHTAMELEILADRMRKELEIEDRTRRLQTYKACFIGSHAVRWMIRNGLASSVAEALEIGDLLIDHGIFSHVNKSHMFENAHLFYRFAEDWPPAKKNTKKRAPKTFWTLRKV